MAHFNINNNNLLAANILPFPSKKEYGCLCEVTEEFSGNFEYLMDKASREIKKNNLLYQTYSDEDHSDMGSHCHAFPSFDLGDGYIAHIGMNWPEKKGYLIIVLTKKFILENGSEDMTLGLIYPDNSNGLQPAFFTRLFFESFSDSTKFGKDLFFLNVGMNGYLSECSGEVRWLFSEGIASGYKYCKYYVFNDFADTAKYQGEELTDEMMDKLDECLWNDE